MNFLIKYNAILLASSVCLFFSCRQNRQVENLEIEPIIAYQGLCNPLFFDEEKFNEPNFPFWFQSQVIQKKNIQSITIKKFVELKDSLNELSVLFNFIYHPNASIKAFKKAQFYDGKVIAEFNSEMIPVDSLYFYELRKPKNDGVKMESIRTFNLDYRSDSMLVFQELGKDNKKVFLPEKSHQNVVTADKISLSNENVVWYYGTPLKSFEKFRLNNLVEKEEHESVQFQAEIPLIRLSRSQRRKEVRYFQYENFNWMGYIDSLKTATGNHVFLKALQVEYSADGLPIRAYESNGVRLDKMRKKVLWTIEYEYFE